MGVVQVNLDDLYSTALIRIGNYLAEQNIREREFPLGKFRVLFQNQIFPLYSKYVYRREHRQIYISYASAYVFPEPAPDLVNKVVPVSVYGLYIGEFMNFRFLSHASYLSTKPLSRFAITWRYEKPRLWCGYQGEVEVEVSYRLRYDDSVDMVEVDEDSRDILQDLCSAYMMIAIGRSRRAVKIADSNIEFDAEGMVTEGEELLKEARERLINLASIDALNF